MLLLPDPPYKPPHTPNWTATTLARHADSFPGVSWISTLALLGAIFLGLVVLVVESAGSRQ